MIKRLIDSKYSYGGSQTHILSEKIIQLKQQLYSQLDQQGKEHLDQLTNIYLEQSASLLENSFEDGFCAAIELVLDYLAHATTNQ